MPLVKLNGMSDLISNLVRYIRADVDYHNIILHYYQILKREIHSPEIMGITVSDCLDYPPKFTVHIEGTSPIISDPPKLQAGLDIEELSFGSWTSHS